MRDLPAKMLKLSILNLLLLISAASPPECLKWAFCDPWSVVRKRLLGIIGTHKLENRVRRKYSRKRSLKHSTLPHTTLLPYTPCMDMHGFTLVYTYTYIYIYIYTYRLLTIGSWGLLWVLQSGCRNEFPCYSDMRCLEGLLWCYPFN